jgi:DNA-directed RNA polymerase subunit RPC12/RpoP
MTTSNPVYEQLLADRRQARSEVNAQISGELSKRAQGWDLRTRSTEGTRVKNLPEAIRQSVVATRALLNTFEFPTPPKISYTGVKKMERSADRNSTIGDGIVMLEAGFYTTSGVKNFIEIPVEIRNGMVVQPSVFFHQGSMEIIAPSSINRVIAQGTFHQPQNSRGQYAAPLSPQESSSWYEQQNSPGMQVYRVNPGMYGKMARIASSDPELARLCEKYYDSLNAQEGDVEGMAQELTGFIQNNESYPVDIDEVFDWLDDQIKKGRFVEAQQQPETDVLPVLPGRKAQEDVCSVCGWPSAYGGDHEDCANGKNARKASAADYRCDTCGSQLMVKGSDRDDGGLTMWECAPCGRLFDDTEVKVAQMGHQPSRAELKMKATPASLIGDRVHTKITFDPDASQQMSDGNITNAIRSFVRELGTRVEWRNWGTIGDTQIESMDRSKGTCEVSFKSSETSAPQLSPAQLKDASSGHQFIQDCNKAFKEKNASLNPDDIWLSRAAVKTHTNPDGSYKNFGATPTDTGKGMKEEWGGLDVDEAAKTKGRGTPKASKIAQEAPAQWSALDPAERYRGDNIQLGDKVKLTNDKSVKTRGGGTTDLPKGTEGVVVGDVFGDSSHLKIKFEDIADEVLTVPANHLKKAQAQVPGCESCGTPLVNGPEVKGRGEGWYCPEGTCDNFRIPVTGSLKTAQELVCDCGHPYKEHANDLTPYGGSKHGCWECNCQSFDKKGSNYREKVATRVAGFAKDVEISFGIGDQSMMTWLDRWEEDPSYVMSRGSYNKSWPRMKEYIGTLIDAGVLKSNPDGSVVRDPSYQGARMGSKTAGSLYDCPDCKTPLSPTVESQGTDKVEYGCKRCDQVFTKDELKNLQEKAWERGGDPEPLPKEASRVQNPEEMVTKIVAEIKKLRDFGHAPIDVILRARQYGPVGEQALKVAKQKGLLNSEVA